MLLHTVQHANFTLAAKMVLGIKIRYRAEKARMFNAYQEDLSQYLEGFLGEDLKRFKLPMPDDCVLKAWRTGWVVCRWYTKEGEVCMPLIDGAMNDHCLHGIVAAVCSDFRYLRASHNETEGFICRLVHVREHSKYRRAPLISPGSSYRTGVELQESGCVRLFSLLGT